MMATRWQVAATTPRSWVISTIDAPVCRPRSRRRSRMRAAVETSRPVVGSSAISSFGCVATAEQDAALGDAARPADELEQGRRRHRLSRPRLAHQPENLTLADVEGGAVDGLDLAMVGGEADGEVLHLDHRLHRTPRIRGSR